MITIVVPATEQYDPVNNEFIPVKDHVLHLEHSLLSISKWEAKWGKAFLGNVQKTQEEMMDYIRCMSLDPLDPNVIKNLTKDNMETITRYIASSQSATKFFDLNDKQKPKETVTSELIYYWMIAYTIPFECQKWHLNRLLTLVRICELKNDPKKNKMSKKEILARNAALNAERRAKLNSNG